jgi:methylated-DNA-[protein]-cysteine S-methyltransferase
VPKPKPTVLGPGLLPAMTPKQAQALLAAAEAGYYAFPRRATTRELARAAGLSRSTFGDHLHLAEAQAVQALLPVVRARAREDGPGAEAAAAQVFSRFSVDLGLYVVLEVEGGRIRRLALSRTEPAGAKHRHPHLTRVLRYLHNGEDDLSDLPVELPPAGFQRDVLEVIRTLEPGQTITYGEIAERIGRPGAARAVGSACGANPVLLVIPCHRVLPSDGRVGHYAGAGGGATKRKLLAREGATFR